MAQKDLKLESVTHSYDGKEVVSNASLDVGVGEIVCLLGPSGCGKSTLLAIASGIHNLQKGRVCVGNRLLADERTSLPPEDRKIGLVFQDYALFPHLNVFENVAFGISSVSAEQKYATVLSALEQVRLSEMAQFYPHMLSGGEQQRVALARALAPEPDVMLLDEPFASLDGRLRDNVREETLAILRKAGTPTVVVTHDPKEAMLMADRIAVMRLGRLVQIDTPKVIYNHPASSFVARLMSEINMLKGVIKDKSALTDIGAVSAIGMCDGQKVEVLIRPQAICLREPKYSEPIAVVRGCRTVGPYNRVEVEVANVESLLVVHTDVGEAIGIGEKVGIVLDLSQVFVFAEEALD